VRIAALAVAIFALVAMTSPAEGADAAEPIEPGSRLRVRVSDSFPQQNGDEELELRGNVVRVSADTVVLRAPPALGELAIPRSSITSLAVSRGKPSALMSAVHGMLNYADRRDPRGRVDRRGRGRV
jgi:hypothetical protein